MPEENFGNMRGGGPLHKDMMFGEVIANVMGNYRIYSAGVFFDRYLLFPFYSTVTQLKRRK